MRISLTRRGIMGLTLGLLAGKTGAAPSTTAATRSSSQRMERGYASGPFGQVHFQTARSGKPVVLIHQAPMSSRQFERV